MDPRAILHRGVSTGLRLGRGTADRVVTLAGPQLGRLADRVVRQVRRPERPTTTAFVPSKKAEPAAQPATTTPSPATVARNIGPQRPSAEPARRSKPRSKSVPGAKLPPPRPSTT